MFSFVFLLTYFSISLSIFYGVHHVVIIIFFIMVDVSGGYVSGWVLLFFYGTKVFPSEIQVMLKISLSCR